MRNSTSQLLKEYDDLMTNPDGVVHQLEAAFGNYLDAEVVLGGIIMVRGCTSCQLQVPPPPLSCIILPRLLMKRARNR